MKVKTTKRFFDLKEQKTREIGDVFEVNKTRFTEIAKYVVELKEKPKKKAK